jgi:hypothetical protein
MPRSPRSEFLPGSLCGFSSLRSAGYTTSSMLEFGDFARNQETFAQTPHAHFLQIVRVTAGSTLYRLGTSRDGGASALDKRLRGLHVGRVLRDRGHDLTARFVACPPLSHSPRGPGHAPCREPVADAIRWCRRVGDGALSAGKRHQAPPHSGVL